MTITFRELIADTWLILKTSGEEMISRYQLEKLTASKSDKKYFIREILLSPKDKTLNLLVKEYTNWLKTNYQLDRLQWLVDFSELIFDVGHIPSNVPFWSYYKTLRGKEPESINYPPSTNFYWLLRRYFREADNRYRDKVCKEYIEKYPLAVADIVDLNIPDTFKEIADEVGIEELRRWIETHKKELFYYPNRTITNKNTSSSMFCDT